MTRNAVYVYSGVMALLVSFVALDQEHEANESLDLSTFQAERFQDDPGPPDPPDKDPGGGGDGPPDPPDPDPPR